MLDDSLKAKGIVEVLLLDADGNIKEQRQFSNKVVNTGLAYIASRMKDATATAMSHMGVGTGSTTEAAGDTGLGTQVARVALDSTSLVTTTATNDAVQYVATFPAGTPGGGTIAITEAGIFNAASAGTMLCRTVFSVINKGPLDTLVITWKVTVA
jgi:hypothetical protein